DKEKRAKYDQFGEQWKNFQATGGPYNSQGFDFNLDLGGGFADLFESLRNRRSGAARRGPRKGEDLQYEIEVTLEEAYNGGARSVNVNAPETCAACRGSGEKPGTGHRQCPACKGTGQGRAIAGISVLGEPCENCHGTG